MKILLIEPEKRPEIVDIDGSLKSMQTAVGGLIQLIYPFPDDPDAGLICNDEGKLLGLPTCRILIDDKYNVIDAISGPFFLCCAPPGSEKFESLSDEKMAEYQAVFSFPVVQV